MVLNLSYETLKLPLEILSWGILSDAIFAELNVCVPSVLFWLVSVGLLLTILYLGQCGPLRVWQTTFSPSPHDWHIFL